MSDTDLLDASDSELVLIPLKFSDTFDRLPASTPPDHAHIIDSSFLESELDDGFDYDIKIWDAVATMLHKISAAALEQFLDSNVTKFKLVHEFKSGPGSSKAKLVIWRRGCKVLIGQYIGYPDNNLFEWDNIIRCVINHDGSWRIVKATFGKYTLMDLQKAWVEEYTTCWMDRELKAADDGSAFARIVGKYIMFNECWDAAQSSWNITPS